MTHPPLKRHESLQPFSRDHYVGLVQAQHLLRAALSPAADTRRQTLARFVEAWDAEIEVHFSDEERLLAELATPREWDRLLEEHAALRAHAQQARAHPDRDPSPQWMTDVGRLLNDHIRWEERCLFPSIERRAGEQRLRELEVHTRDVDSARGRFTCRPRPVRGA